MSTKEEELRAFLQNHPPFSLLPPEQLSEVASKIESQSVVAGQDLLTYQGEVAQSLFIVRQGRVEMMREDDETGMTVFDTLGEGDIFGVVSLIRGQPPEATVRSRVKTELLLLPAETFHALRYHCPPFARFVDSVALDRSLHIHQAAEGGDLPELRLRLRDILQRSLVCVAPETSVREAALLMKRNNVRYIIIDTTPTGIVTDHDLRNRILIEGRDYDTPVGNIMTSPIASLPADSLVFEGLMLLLEKRIRHLPVTEGDRVIGVVTHIDILRQQSHSPLFLPRKLMRARSMHDLRDYTEQVSKTVGTMISQGARIKDIGRVVAVAHGALVEHMLRNAEEEFGPPPCPYAWLVLGSEGRYEQTLRTDQDNALVYADDAPPEAEPYFARLAERIVEQLVACGFPRCPGDIMATNPRWRQPLHVWKQYFSDWIHIPDEEALMRASIFFDYRRVYGKLDIEHALRPVIEEGGKNGVFLARIAKNAMRQSPPLGGFFRDFAVEHDAEGHDVLDLKMRGTALIVDLARLFALEAGCAATNTLTRLHLSAPHSELSELGADQLESAFELISTLRLRHQYGQFRRGEEPTNLVVLSSLSTLERRRLKDAMKVIADIQQSIRSRFGVAWM